MMPLGVSQNELEKRPREYEAEELSRSPRDSASEAAEQGRGVVPDSKGEGTAEVSPVKEGPVLTDTKKRKSHADLMIELAMAQDIRLFVDQYDAPFIRFPSNEIYKTYSLKSGVVKQWLAKLLWDALGKAPGGEAINSALNILRAHAREEGTIPLYNRVAPGNFGDIWIDMGDEWWSAIHITKDGWDITDFPPVLFRRFNHQNPLPKPIRGGSAAHLLEFANLKDGNHKLLFTVATISCLIPEIPHIIVICYGPHGSGKSVAMRAMRAVIDPSIVQLLSLPRNTNELVQQLYHHYCSFYDNIARLPWWFSDAFCRASTGIGISKRELYTDDDDIIYRYRRCCALNGINIMAQRGDMLDRSVLLGFGQIDESSRIEEKKLDALLEEKAGEILGGILDILVRALNIYPTLELKNLYRMADFTRWGYAITEAMGLDGETFLEAYRENVEAQSIETLKASVVAHVLLKFMEKQQGGVWKGAPTELYMYLQGQAEELGVSTRQKAWPKNPYWMSRRLNELSPSLPAAGYRYEHGHTGKQRFIAIYTTGKRPENGVNGVNGVRSTNAINATDAILEDFTGDICADCGLPITDGPTILWEGVDRICSRCAMFRKKTREGQ